MIDAAEIIRAGTGIGFVWGPDADILWARASPALMAVLTFELPDGSTCEVDLVQVLNAGYAGRSQHDVAAHVAELAELGVPGPSVTPALYPVPPYLAQQTERVAVQHGRTSGEAEWALVVAEGGELLLTAACDHTDRDLEVHGVAWSKNAGPDVASNWATRRTGTSSASPTTSGPCRSPSADAPDGKRSSTAHPLPRDTDQFVQGGLGGAVGDAVGDLLRTADASAGDHPVRRSGPCKGRTSTRAQS